MTKPSPALYVVATPIGQLADITLRALEVLKTVDWVAAEDTRHTQPLLQHYGISARLLAVHEHNEASAAGKIIERLAAGESVALVSDAGTPAISDPGSRLVAAVRAAGFRVVPVPGPSAVTAALSAAGLPQGRFLFYGFLPPKSTARRQVLSGLAQLAANLVFYEAPHRVLETLDDLHAVFGDARRVVIAKELTKLFEAFHVAPLGQAAAWFAEDPQRLKGEFALIVEAPAGEANDAKQAEAERVLKLLLAEGLPVKQAAGLAAQIAGGNRKALYQSALALRQGEAPAGEDD
jgi:16S rRNA (cytidine1402-2'-O)-methyltransferase